MIFTLQEEEILYRVLGASEGEWHGASNDAEIDVLELTKLQNVLCPEPWLGQS